MRIYLTGGSGLLGSHLAEQLRGRGDDVVCLQRIGSDTSFLEGLGCRIVAGDVREDPSSLQEGMAGADAVVHAAALVYAGGPWPRLRTVNVDGTEHVFRAAAQSGITRAVHISSVAVYGGSRGPVDETTPTDTPIAPGNLYARSKREAEARARRVASAAGLRLTVLRPAALYGERDRLLSLRVARLVRWPLVPLLGDGRNTLAVVYAGNAADAVARVLKESQGGVYNVGMDHPLTQRGLIEGMARALGRKPRLVSVPELAVRQAARLGEVLGLTMPGAGDLTLERVARLSLGDNPFRTEKIRRELAWEPPFSHEQGLRRTARWILARGGRAGPPDRGQERGRVGERLGGA